MVPPLALAPLARRVPDGRLAAVPYLGQVARSAEQSEFEAALTPTRAWCEDAWLSTAMLSLVSEPVKAMVAFRPGLATSIVSLPPTSSSTSAPPKSSVVTWASKLGSEGRLVISTQNFGHWYPRFRVALGFFDYDRRGILDEMHLRFFSRRGLLRVVELAKLRVESLDYSGLPLSVLQPGQRGAVSTSLSKLDRLLVKSRPTFFGYQFVAVLCPRNNNSRTHA